MKRKAFCFALSLLLMLLLPLNVFAVLSLPIAGSGENFYVNDQSGAFSQAVKAQLCQNAAELEAEIGVQLVIVTVDFLGGEEIASYAKRLFEAWQIGTPERNTGFLLLLVTGEENYYAASGEGFKDELPSAKIAELLEKSMEADFADGEYEQAALAASEAITNEILTIHSQNAAAEDETALTNEKKTESDEKESGAAVLLKEHPAGVVIAALLLVLLILLAIMFKIRADNLARRREREARRRKKRGESFIDYAGRGRDTDNSRFF